ncbi:hypothetical protein [Nocardia exalbida]|uniref:hypothetical protein n=1 Tax=Nocardia exalbida TaxID=290231 RepID=UPI0002D955F1|nr:hypothetical protein [Nocardia exalbida]
MNTTPRMRRHQRHAPADPVAPVMVPTGVADRSGGLVPVAVIEAIGSVRGRRRADPVSPSGDVDGPASTV